jgi:predicted nucleic acid-binding protein
MAVEHLVVDASALVDLLVGERLDDEAAAVLDGRVLHAPAHLDAEVLSALGRLHRAGHLAAADVRRHLADVAGAPIQRHPLSDLLADAWRRRDRLRLADALYVVLGQRIKAPIVTSDARLARAVPGTRLLG